MNQAAVIFKVILGVIIGIGFWILAFVFPTSFLATSLLRWLWAEFNPVLILMCVVLNSDQCIGLGFDGGPLEWAEYLWFWLLPFLYAGTGIVLVFFVDWVRFKLRK